MESGQQDSQGNALTSFLLANEALIHINTRKLALAGDQEGVRMALNQIHYYSLQAPRPKPEIQSQNDVHNPSSKAEQWNIICSFMESLAHYIEQSVLRDALTGDEKALSLALGQIHYHSLEATSHHADVTHPFKDALLKKPVQRTTISHPIRAQREAIFLRNKLIDKSHSRRKADHSVFFSGILLGINNFDNNINTL
ncbi:hypothetical protein ACET3Z_028313 [Daucus carota]